MSVMRACTAFSLVCLAFGFVDGRGGASETEVHGKILVPSNGAARVQRCLELTAPGATQGTAGWILKPTPGRKFGLTADQGEQVSNFDIIFYPTLGECSANPPATTFSGYGDEEGIVPETASFAIVVLSAGIPGSAFIYRESPGPAPIPEPVDPANSGKPFTVVALVDSAFSPYHYDFLGHQHPWNKDADPGNDFDPYADPRSYITGYPGAKPIKLTIPDSPDQDVSSLAEGPDKEEWQKLARSTEDHVHMYRFPGTKIIGAINFSEPFTDIDGTHYPGTFYGPNDEHGTASAASSSGNIHGTCPECLVVMLSGFYHEAVAWAASQPWIDVITNSWGESLINRENISFNNPLEITRKAVESGQVITWSAGNGLLNAFDVPMLTYWSSQKGPDWIVTVGAAEPGTEQQYSGAGKPVDISSIGSAYPSTGGTTAAGEGTHSGTSNASPVIGGTFAKVIQKARDLLGDHSEGHQDGIVASGNPFDCGDANQHCVLSDGILTRDEVEQVIYETVRPSPYRPSADTTWPSTEYSYYYQGRGVVSGRSLTNSKFEQEQQNFFDALTGSKVPGSRPRGEKNWFVIDSKCRQRLWGQWSGGLYKNVDPPLDPVADPIAMNFDAWCSNVEQDSFAELATEYGYQNYIVPFAEDTPRLPTGNPADPPTPGRDGGRIRVRVVPPTLEQQGSRSDPSDSTQPAPPNIVRAVRVVSQPVGAQPLQITALLLLTAVVSSATTFFMARKLAGRP